MAAVSDVDRRRIADLVSEILEIDLEDLTETSLFIELSTREHPRVSDRTMRCAGRVRRYGSPRTVRYSGESVRIVGIPFDRRRSAVSDRGH